MKKLLIPANITPVILVLMVSHSVLEANNSVEFYFFGSKDDARFLFAGDDVVLMCEAKGFLNPTLKLTFNGNELFDGDNLVAQNDSRLVNRNQKEQDTRQDTVNHLFGGSVQINHHLSQYVYATASERAEETTFAYDSVPYTTNQDDDYDDDKRHVRPPTVNTEIPQANPVYESAPSNEMPPHHLQDVALDKKVLSLDPVYKETPTKITHLKENNGNTEQVDKSKKSSYEPVDRSDQERPPSAVYATVDRKNKNKKSETNASNLEEKAEMSNTDPTRDHVYAYSNAEIEYDAITRL
ncbi:hypothetical protein HOLleu_26844 [Holothuria leucospilota]|uniref:Uncharacterized protein n=1 Tax=Holothuria leucospilota TaxID=206669 RepID=A0A9Q1H2A2_HOLLE|nr:hypothetical protein HOLleu_26844 [Holothuria leucospilota]